MFAAEEGGHEIRRHALGPASRCLVVVGSHRLEGEIMTQEQSPPAGAPSNDDYRGRSPETAPKPRWTRPEITSFKPVRDAQGVSYRIGDGVSNLS